MTDKELKAKILAEIERLHREVYKSPVFNGQAQFALDRVVDFINSLPEEPVSEDVEEASHRYMFSQHTSPLNEVMHQADINAEKQYQEDIKNAFKEGARWQKLKIIYKAIIYNDKIYPTTYEDEPTEFCLDGGEEVRLITEAVNNGLLKQGDKVKVIIIKDESV